MASATFKEGESAGMPVPLLCTWYNISLDESDSSGLVQIPEVRGACYQPCVDDVGKKILVHAIPVSSHEQEY